MRRSSTEHCTCQPQTPIVFEQLCCVMNHHDEPEPDVHVTQGKQAYAIMLETKRASYQPHQAAQGSSDILSSRSTQLDSTRRSFAICVTGHQETTTPTRPTLYCTAALRCNLPQLVVLVNSADETQHHAPSFMAYIRLMLWLWTWLCYALNKRLTAAQHECC